MAGRPRLLRLSKEALPIRSNTKSNLVDSSDAFNGLLLATFQIRFHLELHRAQVPPFLTSTHLAPG